MNKKIAQIARIRVFANMAFEIIFSVISATAVIKHLPYKTN